jgi:branched-chain amino acid transport system substrate-binding protein
MRALLTRRTVRVRTASLLTVVLVTTLAACDGDPESATVTTSVPTTTTTIAPRPDDGVLRLGAFLPRSGPGAELGERMIAAVQDAVIQINAAGGVLGNAVSLTVVDENSALSPLRSLIASGVDAIIGPASSTVALAQLDLAVQADSGVVTCSPSATALALDDYPDNKLFFRTVPSDSLQMAAIVRRAQQTGVDSVAVGYLDDPYGRALADAFVAEAEARGTLEIGARVGFQAGDPSLDVTTLGDAATDLLESGAGVVVVLGDADTGSRMLKALDEAAGDDPPEVIINDAIRDAHQTIQTLSAAFKANLSGVAPFPSSFDFDGPAGFFSAHAVDCVNLIALAAVQAQSDSPAKIQANMAAVSDGGRVCDSFADCSNKLLEGLRIDYNGLSGSVELSTISGDVTRGWFEVFGFNADGIDQPIDGAPRFEVP